MEFYLKDLGMVTGILMLFSLVFAVVAATASEIAYCIKMYRAKKIANEAFRRCWDGELSHELTAWRHVRNQVQGSSKLTTPEKEAQLEIISERIKECRLRDKQSRYMQALHHKSIEL